jgi:sugar phosphate isomerase/epimerase
MKISIASYSFHGLIASGRMDVFGYLESVRYRYHLDAADIWNGLLGTDPQKYLSPEFLRAVKEGLEERGLVLANYHADGCHIWEDDPAEREKNHRLALRHLEAAEYLGARTVRIDAGGRGRHWTAAQFDHIVRRYREFAGRAADGGYRIGPETHWGAELLPDNMERLARAVDHGGYGILLHMGHWDEGDPDGNDRRLAPWACHTHLDMKTTRNRLESALRILGEAGYEGYLGVEHHTGRNEYEEVAAQVAEVRRALALVRDASPPAGRPRNPLLPAGID